MSTDFKTSLQATTLLPVQLAQMDTYQFSQPYSASCVAFSPGSTFLATASEDRIVVRATATLNPVRTWTCTLPDPSSSRAVNINSLLWSPSGSRLLAQSSSSGVSWVFDLAQDQVVSRLSGDIARAEWGADEVVALSERGLSLYDLSSSSPRFIQNAHGFAWSPDRRYLAVAERHHSKEHIGIYDKESLVRHFPIDIAETSGISWSPCGKWLAVWDRQLSFSMRFYSPVGAHLGDATDVAEDIRRVEWSPSGRHIAIGDSGGNVTVLEAESWAAIAVLDQSAPPRAPVWAEPPSGTKPEGITQFLPGEAMSSKAAITWLGFSPDGQILYHGSDRTLFVNDFILEETSSTPEVCPHATVVFNHPIKSVEICPTASRIAVVTRSLSLYLWDGLGAEGVTIPADSDFNPASLCWAPDGHSVAIRGKSTFCLVYEELEAERESKWEDE